MLLSLRLACANLYSMEKTLFQNFRVILSDYRAQFLQAFLMVLVSNGLLILNPLVFRQAVMAMEGTGSGYLYGLIGASLGLWVILLLSIAGASALFKYWMRIAFISISRDVERKVRSKIFTRIQAQSMTFFDHHGIGELLSRLTNDITTYRDTLGPGILYPMYSLTIVTPGLIALFSISVPLASMALLPLVLIPLMNFLIRGPIYQTSKKVQESLAKMSDMVQEHYSGIQIIKSYTLETAAYQRFSDICQRFKLQNFKLSTLQGLVFPFFTLVAKIVTVLLVMTAGVIILSAWGELTTADFISFMWIQSYIFFPVLMLGWIIPIYERGRAAYDRLVEIYEEPIEVEEGGEATLRIPENAAITFQDLTFCYPNTFTPVLSHLNLEIKGGTFVGITGMVGAGKTTLFRLLNREYEIPRGMISIAGRDIHDYPLEAFQRAMVTVEQVPFLFSTSIAENVRFGRGEAPQQEIEMVSRYADLHETVLEFPEQYETIIGERGVTLSGGQKLRVAMARAFLVNRSILLLDDIFSAVDSATEKRIFQAMRENFSGKTVLLITHRVSTLNMMDRVIYMRQGSVVEDGTPQKLIERKGHYAALVELQQMGDNV